MTSRRWPAGSSLRTSKPSSGSVPIDPLDPSGRMIVGVPKEIKANENRVALVPAGAEALVADGHKVLVERAAGMGSGFTDQAYERAGATVLATAAEVWKQSEMILKVKE